MSERKRPSSQYETGVVRALAAREQFPHPGEFYGKSPMEHTALFASAPWHHPVAFRDEDLLDKYSTADVLSDGLHRSIIETDDWARHCILPDRALVKVYDAARGRKMSCAEARAAFTRVVYQRLHRFPGTTLVPPEYEFDFCLYRTRGEERYGDRLVDVVDAALERGGEPEPDERWLCFDRPILRAEFRYLRRNDDKAFWESMKWERRTRSRMGLIVPYQNVEVEFVQETERRTRYVEIPDHWASYEVPRGFNVDLPPVLTYCGKHMIRNRASGMWSVFYTEWIARVGAALLWECYDNYRLFWVPPAVRYWIRHINLDVVLGSPGNYAELRHLLDKIDDVNWDAVNVRNQQRGAGQRDRSPISKSAVSGDYVNYDPWNHEEVSRERAFELRKAERHVADDHRIGYVFSAFPDVSGLHPDEDEMDESDDTPANGGNGNGAAAGGNNGAEADKERGERESEVPLYVEDREGDPQNVDMLDVDETPQGRDDDVVGSFRGSGMTWLDDARKARGTQLEFLRRFLHDAGVEMGTDVTSLDSMRTAVKRQLGGDGASPQGRGGPSASSRAQPPRKRVVVQRRSMAEDPEDERAASRNVNTAPTVSQAGVGSRAESRGTVAAQGKKPVADNASRSAERGSTGTPVKGSEGKRPKTT